jgi:predicted ATPase
LIRQAGERGFQVLAVLLDDLHWADSAGLELLLYLARRVHIAEWYTAGQHL